MSRDFPGTNSNYLDAGDVAAIDITGTALTVHAWIRPDALSGVPRIVGKWGATLGVRQYLLDIQTGGQVRAFVADAGGNDPANGVTVLSIGVWQAVALRKNGTGGDALQAFLNGVLDGTVTSNRSIQNTTSGLRFGNDVGNANPFDGLIAEVGIWDVALTDAEIASLAKGFSPLLVRPQNLKGYWPLWGTGSPERDYSGLGSHATVTGTVNAGNKHPPVMPFVLPTRIAPAAPGVLFVESIPTFQQQPYAPPITKIPAGLRRRKLPKPADDFETGQVPETIDAATIYVDIEASGVDIKEMTDAATVYIDITNTGGECYSGFSGEMLGEGEATSRWRTGAYQTRWSGEVQERWVLSGLSTESGC